jgi:hypothetical protein
VGETFSRSKKRDKVGLPFPLFFLGFEKKPRKKELHSSPFAKQHLNKIENI